jgi:mannose-6-phosphate isomerase-like protein (cupin superfamily)
MNSPILAPPLAGQALGKPGDSFVIAEWQDPGGHSGAPFLIAPPHVHHNDEEAWYVLEGVLRVQRGDEEVEVRAGCGVLVPRGTPHTYWNPAEGRCRYLLIMTPKIYQLIQAIHAASDRGLPRLTELFRKYDSELL